jgi:hypothetical protein
MQYFQRGLSAKSVFAGVFWTSATDAGCDGKFGWCSVNRMVRNASWALNKPDNVTGDCVMVSVNKTRASLTNADCQTQRKYICEVR